MQGLTDQEKAQALVYVRNGADFMFIPSSELCNMIVVGSVETIELNSILSSILLMRKPIRLDTNMVINYCRGILDKKNTWLLDHGDIKVVSPQYKKPERVKPKKENPLKENNDE